MQKCMIMLLVLVMLLSMTACKDQAPEAQIEFFENEGNSTDLTDQTNENIWEEDIFATEDFFATENTVPTEDTVPAEDTEPTEAATEKEEKPLEKPVRGSISGNTYTNDFASLTFTKPKNWTYQSDANIALYMGVADEMYDLDCESFLQISGTMYDMMVMDETKRTSVSITFENLETTNNVGLSESDYLHALKRQLTVNDPSCKFGSRGQAYLSGNQYATLPVTLEYEGMVVRQTYYVRAQGKYMIGVLVTLVDTEISTVEAMFSK